MESSRQQSSFRAIFGWYRSCGLSLVTRSHYITFTHPLTLLSEDSNAAFIGGGTEKRDHTPESLRPDSNTFCKAKHAFATLFFIRRASFTIHFSHYLIADIVLLSEWV
jgi:hypothetical protein